jgi:hypothetical protein
MHEWHTIRCGVMKTTAALMMYCMKTASEQALSRSAIE